METIRTVMASGTEIQEGLSFLKTVDFVRLAEQLKDPLLWGSGIATLAVFLAPIRSKIMCGAAVGAVALATGFVGTQVFSFSKNPLKPGKSVPASHKAAVFYTAGVRFDNNLPFQDIYQKMAMYTQKHSQEFYSESERVENAVLATCEMMNLLYDGKKVSTTQLNQTLDSGAAIADAYCQLHQNAGGQTAVRGMHFLLRDLTSSITDEMIRAYEKEGRGALTAVVSRTVTEKAPAENRNSLWVTVKRRDKGR